jgi:hypothetical protein
MVTIVGAGMAGLLAANMLSHRDPHVVEAQSALPNNHSAVLRFRTSIIGDALNIPFKKVTLVKSHLAWKNLPADALSYSYKNSGMYRSDRSIISGDVTDNRWIAPPDLIGIMASRLRRPIKFGEKFAFKLSSGWRPVISTVPMPTLMFALQYPKIDQISFKYTSGINIHLRIKNCDAYVGLLVPDPKIPFSRISITGDEMILEIANQVVDQSEAFVKLCVAAAVDMLGINAEDIYDVSLHKQAYAKINRIEDDVRKDFIFWATDNFGIFSLGRFATWRPGLLLDDLVQDIRLIDKWLDKADRYAIARAR